MAGCETNSLRLVKSTHDSFASDETPLRDRRLLISRSSISSTIGLPLKFSTSVTGSDLVRSRSNDWATGISDPTEILLSGVLTVSGERKPYLLTVPRLVLLTLYLFISFEMRDP